MEEVKKEENKNSKWWIYVICAIVVILVILLLLNSCGRKYKIKLHYGDEVIEVDSNFKLTDLEVEGGEISFLVDSDGHILPPGSKSDPSKEYSAHIIPEGKEKVKVTYKIEKESFTVEYQKGSGLLFPKNPTKKGYVFIGWKNEATNEYPQVATPVNEDMVLVAVFEKSVKDGGTCTLNCDTNKDGTCDLNCDINSDGKPDTNIDTDGDGKPDLNVDPDHDGKCNANCDTNGDGKPDTNIDTDGDGICDENCNEDALIPEFSDDKVKFSCNDYSYAYAWFGNNGNWKFEFISLVFDGKNIPESEFKAPTDSDPESFQGLPIKVYNYGKDYIGSGKTVDIEMHVIRIDSTGQKYYHVESNKFIFEGNCDAKNVVKIEFNGDSIVCGEGPNYRGLPIKKLTEKGLVVNDSSTFKVVDSILDGSYDGVSLACEISKNAFTIKFLPDYSESKLVSQFLATRVGKTTTDTCIYEVITDGIKYEITYNNTIRNSGNCPKEDKPTPQPTPTPVDNGTISLSTSNACLIGNGTTKVTASVNNALDGTINWTKDSCLTLSGTGNVRTVTGSGCGAHPKVTGTLNNGKSSSVTLNYENSLSVTVTKPTGEPAEFIDGKYYGNSLTITTNVPAHITGSYLAGDSNSLRTSATTQGAAGTTVTIKTECGQTKTIAISPIIN